MEFAGIWNAVKLGNVRQALAAHRDHRIGGAQKKGHRQFEKEAIGARMMLRIAFKDQVMHR